MSGPEVPGVSQQPSVHCENLVVTRSASLPGGTSGQAKGFRYVCLGTEASAGFPVLIAGLPSSYVAIAQPLVRAIGGNLVPAAVVANISGGVTVATGAAPAAGDTINIVAAST